MQSRRARTRSRRFIPGRVLHHQWQSSRRPYRPERQGHPVQGDVGGRHVRRAFGRSTARDVPQPFAPRRRAGSAGMSPEDVFSTSPPLTPILSIATLRWVTGLVRELSSRLHSFNDASGRQRVRGRSLENGIRVGQSRTTKPASNPPPRHADIAARVGTHQRRCHPRTERPAKGESHQATDRATRVAPCW